MYLQAHRYTIVLYHSGVFQSITIYFIKGTKNYCGHQARDTTNCRFLNMRKYSVRCKRTLVDAKKKSPIDAKEAHQSAKELYMGGKELLLTPQQLGYT